MGPLQEREFRNLYAARACSLLGDGLLPVALAFAILNSLHSASDLGYVLAARTVAFVASLIVAGVVADRLPRRLVLISSDLLRCAAQGATAALLLTDSARLGSLLALAVVYGVGDAFFRPTSTGIVPQTVSAARLQQANALIALTSSGFSIVGPVIAAVLVTTVGAGWAVAADAATFAISAAFISRLGRFPRIASETSFFVELREGWAVFTSRTWLWVDGVFSALGNFMILAPFEVLGPLVAHRHLGGAGAWAAISAGFAGGAVIGGIGLLRLRPKRPLLVGVPPLMLLGAPVALLAGPAPTVAIALGAFAGGLGLAVFNTLFETTVQGHVPPQALSRVAAIDWMLSGSLQPIGFGVVGPLAAAVGVQGVLVASAVWAFASPLFIVSLRSVRELRAAG